jgi:hypothetical protein
MVSRPAHFRFAEMIMAALIFFHPTTDKQQPTQT